MKKQKTDKKQGFSIKTHIRAGSIAGGGWSGGDPTCGTEELCETEPACAFHPNCAQ